MKEVISKNELRNVIEDALKLICGSVASTLGPSGNNVIISNNLSPFITNDGVTIARNIESNDKKINAILSIVKEASLKTNDLVGDGTTTTLVLLHSIYKEGLKEISKNNSAIELKNELNNLLYEVIDRLNEMKMKPTNKDYLNISKVSSEDENIGTVAFEAFNIMKNKHSILICESNTGETYYEIRKGYNLIIDDISHLYFRDNKQIILSNAYIFIIEGKLFNLDTLSDIINEGIQRNKNIVFLVDDVSIEIQNSILLYYLKYNKNIFIFKISEYGERNIEIKKDLSYLLSCSIKNINYENIVFSDAGLSKNVIINKEEIIIINDNDTSKRLIEIQNEYNNCFDDYEKEFLESRISKLENGILTLYVGGNTKTEIKEKMMRYEDAICSLETAKNGVIVGGGLSLFKIANSLDNKTCASRVLKKAFEVPFKLIIKNSGINYNEIKEEIILSNYNKIYNIKKRVYEDIKDSTIIDPVCVVIETIKNAISISSLLLTSTYLVINEECSIDKNNL